MWTSAHLPRTRPCRMRDTHVNSLAGACSAMHLMHPERSSQLQVNQVRCFPLCQQANKQAGM